MNSGLVEEKQAEAKDMASSKPNFTHSLPEIRIMLSEDEDQEPPSRMSQGTESNNGRQSTIKAQLPLDKSNCRFLKQSVQSFLHQEGTGGNEELARLELSIDVLESYCSEIMNGCDPKPQRLDMIEKQAHSIGQNANAIWAKKKRGHSMSSVSSTPNSPGAQRDEDSWHLSFIQALQRCNELLTKYCNFLTASSSKQNTPVNSDDMLARPSQPSTNTLQALQHCHSEPLLDRTLSNQKMIEELLDSIQSQGYHVRFCHVGVTDRKSKLKTMSLKAAGSPQQVSYGISPRKKCCLGAIASVTGMVFLAIIVVVVWLVI